MIKRKTTSIKVNPDLWREFKVRSIRTNTDISDILDRMIRREMKRKR